MQLFDAGLPLPAGPVRFASAAWYDHIAFAAHDPVFYHACGILGTFGGLGFLVIYNLITFRGRKRVTALLCGFATDQSMIRIIVGSW